MSKSLRRRIFGRRSPAGCSGHRRRHGAGPPPYSLPAAACLLGLLASSAAPGTASPDRAEAGRAAIEVHDVACLPKEDNGAVYADVRGIRLGDQVRLYFRRLHHLTEDFYYVPMDPVRADRYVGVLPKPHDRKLKRTELEDGRDASAPDDAWARWWRTKDASVSRDPNDDLDADRIEREATVGGKAEPLQRTWMQSASPEELQEWLEALVNEPAEYYVAVFDAAGTPVTRTEFQRTVVAPDCPPIEPEAVRRALPAAWAAELGEPALAHLVARMQGRTQVLTVGETAPWQRGEGVFHWKCDGVVTRIDPEGIYRPDEVCRACVFILPLWLVGLSSAVGSGLLLELTEPPLASPTTP